MSRRGKKTSQSKIKSCRQYRFALAFPFDPCNPKATFAFNAPYQWFLQVTMWPLVLVEHVLHLKSWHGRSEGYIALAFKHFLSIAVITTCFILLFSLFCSSSHLLLHPPIPNKVRREKCLDICGLVLGQQFAWKATIFGSKRLVAFPLTPITPGISFRQNISWNMELWRRNWWCGDTEG